MTEADMTIDEILEENDRRNFLFLAPYDPLEGSDPGRIDFERCRRDFAYWAATCCHIKNKKGGADILFRLNYPQRKMVRELELMRTTGNPIRMILLKARQWGGSTCAQLYMAWLQMMMKPGLNSLIIAHQHSATAEIRDMFMRMINSYPEREDDKKEGKKTENVGPGTFRVIEGNFKVKVGSAERPDSCRGGGYPEVVAQWRGHTDFDLLAWNVARIARYYDDSLLVIESNTLETRDRDRMVEGDQSHFLLHQLRDAYSNLYARQGSPDDIRQGIPVKYGFHTNVATKPLIIANLIKVVREGLYVERDGECLDEYLTYEQRQDGGYGAISGKHDDLLMTRAIGLHICFNEMEMPRRVAKADDDYAYSRRGSYASF